jgi:hypothetical protein
MSQRFIQYLNLLLKFNMLLLQRGDHDFTFKNWLTRQLRTFLVATSVYTSVCSLAVGMTPGSHVDASCMM